MLRLVDKVAVIVPIYKVEAYLAACVASIRAQTYTNISIVLVDDGSPDRCGELCEELAREDARITVIHRANGGLSAARNSGIEWALGQPDISWLTFVDGDDTVHFDFVRALLVGAKDCKTKISAVAYEKVSELCCSDMPTDAVFMPMSVEAFWCAGQVRATVSTCKLYSRELFDDIRFPEGLLHEDECTTYKLLFKVPLIAVSDAPLYHYLQRRDSIMGRMALGWTPQELERTRGYHAQIAFLRHAGFSIACRESIRVLAFCYAAQYRNLKRQSAYREYLPLLRKWAKGLLRLARRREDLQMGDVWLAYFVLWPFIFNHVTWPLVRAYDLLTSVGIAGLVKQVRLRVCCRREG